MTGPYANLLSRCATAPAFSPAADALYGASYLSDGYVEKPSLFGSAAADSRATWDLNAVVNADMTGNSGGNLTTWVEEKNGATSDVTYDATGGVGGGAGMKIVTDAGGGSYARAYQDVIARPGEKWSVAVQLKSQTSKTARVRIQNRWNLKWLTSGGAWQTSQTDIFTETGTSFAAKGPLTFTVEDWATLKWPTAGYVLLRIFVACDDTSAGTGIFADDIVMWPSWSWFSVHGHNLQPQLSLDLRRDTAAFSGAGTFESSMAIYSPTMFYALADGAALKTDRYLRLQATGTPSEAIWYGEAFLGQYSTLLTAPGFGSIRPYRDQVRMRPTAGTPRIRQLGDLERRIWEGPFKDLGLDTWDDWWKNVARLSGFGAHPIVMAHDDLDPECAIYGELPGELAENTAPGYGVRVRTLVVQEHPFPSWVS